MIFRNKKFCLSPLFHFERFKLNFLSLKKSLRITISAPPRPSSRVEIVYNTIHSTDMGIRYSTSMFNTKHGYLKKSALIVAEVSNNNENIINSIIDNQNKTLVRFSLFEFPLQKLFISLLLLVYLFNYLRYVY